MKMLGKSIRNCPGGRFCTCNPQGAARPEKRTAKRRERQAWKKEIAR